MRRAQRGAWLGWLLAATLVMAVGCGADDEGGFQPSDTTADVGGDSGGGTADAAEDVPAPPLGEPEWRLVSTDDLDPGAEEWRGVHGVALSDEEFLTAVVGTNGTVALYDSATDDWSFRNTGDAIALRGVWVEGREKMLVVGEAGLSKRWDPTLGESGDWLLAPIAAAGPDVDLLDVWGDQEEGQWVCGDDGIVARWEDDPVAPRWNTLLFPGDNETTSGTNLEAIWGTSQAEIFAVGGKLIIRYDGGQWDRWDVDQRVRDVWGTRNGPVYVAAEAGTIYTLNRDTDEWDAVTTSLPLLYFSVFGTDESNVFAGAIDSKVATRTSAGGWEVVFVEEKPGSPVDLRIPRNLRFSAIWGTSATNLFLVSNGPHIVRRARFAITN